jgi:hypothetical protein
MKVKLYAIPNFGNYTIFRTGEVYSLYSYKFIKQHDDSNGYLIVSLRINGVKKNYKVHKLVAKVYLENPNNLPQVNHIDGNKYNNCLSNLEWVSASDNMKHAYNNGLMKKNREKRVLDTETGIFYNSIKEAAIAKNINHNTMRGLIINNKTSIIHI